EVVVTLVLQVKKDQQEILVKKVIWVPRDEEDLSEALVIRVQMVVKVQKEYEELTVDKDLLVRKGIKV
ncbi:hypothetical protein, partial [Salmonella sp. s54412]